MTVTTEVPAHIMESPRLIDETEVIAGGHINVKEEALKDYSNLEDEMNAFETVPSDSAIHSPILAASFLVLGVAVIIVIILKRSTPRAEMMQCNSLLKSRVLSYGTINFPSSSAVAANTYTDVEKPSILEWNEVIYQPTAGRQTKFISLSEIWKEKQMRNLYQIPEENEEEGRYTPPRKEQFRRSPS